MRYFCHECHGLSVDRRVERRDKARSRRKLRGAQKDTRHSCRLDTAGTAETIEIRNDDVEPAIPIHVTKSGRHRVGTTGAKSMGGSKRREGPIPIPQKYSHATRGTVLALPGVYD